MLFCTQALFSTTLFAIELPGPLVDTQWVQENLDKIVLLDVRDDVKSFEEKRKKKKGLLVVGGHIPGAVLVPWTEVTAKRQVDGKEIEGLLPEKGKF